MCVCVCVCVCVYVCVCVCMCECVCMCVRGGGGSLCGGDWDCVELCSGVGWCGGIIIQGIGKDLVGRGR